LALVDPAFHHDLVLPGASEVVLVDALALGLKEGADGGLRRVELPHPFYRELTWEIGVILDDLHPVEAKAVHVVVKPPERRLEDAMQLREGERPSDLQPPPDGRVDVLDRSLDVVHWTNS